MNTFIFKNSIYLLKNILFICLILQNFKIIILLKNKSMNYLFKKFHSKIIYFTFMFN